MTNIIQRAVRITAILALLVPASAAAGGFQIGEMGVKAMGMANAFTAIADDPSAQWYNPAGSAFQQGTHLTAGGDVIIVPSLHFTTNNLNPAHPASTSMKSKTLFAPHVYLSHALNAMPLTVGLGINSPFGLESDWPANGPFAISNTFSKIRMLNINPNIAWRINDRLAIAGGADYYRVMDVRLDNTVQMMKGSGDGWGGNIALLYRDDRYSIGLSYRSRVRVDINDGIATGGPALAVLGAPWAVGATGAVRTRVVFPDQLNFGIAWRLDDRWRVSLDVDWVNWKTFDNLDFHYAPSLLSTAITGGTNFRTIPERWHATTAIRAGLEWDATRQLAIRAGYTFDPTPVKNTHYSPGIPDRNRHLFSIGAGYQPTANLTFDAAYMFVYFVNRNQTASTGTDAVRNGHYSGNVHLISASMSYAF